MKTTRKINGAKVTREWPVTFVDETQKFTSKVFDKISELIRGAAKDIVKHKIVTCKNSHDGHGLKQIGNAIGESLLSPEKQKPSSLDKKLTKLRKKGVRVLNFWREADRWQIKVMT